MPGFEEFFNRIPVLSDNDELLAGKVSLAKSLMNNLADNLRKDDKLTLDPGKGNFNRFILAIEDPTTCDNGGGTNVIKAGSEIVLAVWGDGFSSPVHGHASGFLHEEIISGKVRVNTYQKINDQQVRLVETTIAGPGELISVYNKHSKERDNLIHNFTAIGHTVTLHFLPEYNRDGRDNKFAVEYFEDRFELNVESVERIDSYQGMYLQPGDVVMVRSTNVPEYGDHFIVVTGPPVVKPHGLRVQDKAIRMSPNGYNLLDLYEQKTGLTLLKLKREAQLAFLTFHEIRIGEKGKLVFANDIAEMMEA